MAKKKQQKKKSKKVGAGPPKPEHISDLTSVGEDATTASQRRAALDACLAGSWAASDIATLERIDEGGWHGWAMWKR